MKNQTCRYGFVAFLLIASFLAPGNSFSQCGTIITTLAGDGTPGYMGDGGPALFGEIQNPYGIGVDVARNIYIADYGNNVVRMISAGGIITTFAGGGSGGDGGPATDAAINGPIGVVADRAGNVYICEYMAGAVRVVNTAGIISTLARGLSNPTGICIDVAGNLYVANQTASQVKKITPGGFVSNYAGNGSHGYFGDGGQATDAMLSDVTGLAIDTAGNLYLSCWDEQHVRKVDKAGIISTIAGIGSPGFSGDGGPATAAELSQPYNIAVDLTGNVYIADVANNRIRKVDIATHKINTVAGSGLPAYSGDGIAATIANMNPDDVFIDPLGNMLISDAGNNRIRLVSFYPGSSITGASNVCEAASIALSDTASGTGKWISSDISIARVGSTGIVTGISGGTCIISYAATKVCGTTYGFDTITVNPLPSAGTITGSANVCLSATTSLGTTSPGGTWSGTSATASVSGTGVVTGITKGTAVITYTVTNGCGNASTTKSITVISKPNPGIIAGPQDLCLTIDPITLSDTVSGGTWASSNTNAAVSDSLITGLSIGFDTILYIVANSCGKDSASHYILVSVCETGVEAVAKNDALLQVYPNPSRGAFTVHFSESSDEPVRISIANLLGECIKTLNSESNRATDLILDAPPGIYFLSVMTTHGKYTTKITVE